MERIASAERLLSAFQVEDDEEVRREWRESVRAAASGTTRSSPRPSRSEGAAALELSEAASCRVALRRSVWASVIRDGHCVAP
jgi:hypothetical protein